MANGSSYYGHPVDVASGHHERISSNSVLLDPLLPLQAWAQIVSHERSKPKLVILAASGGGYRATFWTALVLDWLRSESAPGMKVPGLAGNVRVLSGASGGMLAAAYFAVQQMKGDNQKTVVNQILEDVRNRQAYRHPDAVDSLTAVARRFATRDVLNALWPFPTGRDRGTVLESQWSLLNITFSDLRASEKEGRTPSLIFSPVLVETGEPFFISNISLEAERGAVDGGSTLQFFTLFPEAHGFFKLQTAVRMNATFPYITPTVRLPTVAKWHVIDAAYYDNYGVSSAITYLSNQRVRTWLRDHTSGVVFIQIRAFPAAAGVLESDDQCLPRSPEGTGNTIASAIGWLTAPLDALLASRETSMYRRNNQQFDLLKEQYNRYDPHFLFTTVLENAARSSMSWYLPYRELECMRAQLTSKENLQSFNDLARAWSRAN